MTAAKDARALSPSELTVLRRRGMALAQRHWPVAKIAEALGVCAGTVYKWLRNERKVGTDLAIQGGKRGRKTGDKRLMSLEQERRIATLIRDKTPDQLKFEFALWTRRAVRDLILDEYGIHMAIRTVGDFLERIGFTSQRPMTRAIEQKPEQVQAWLKETYPEIVKRSRAEGAVIYWGDETAVKADSNWVTGYAPKGKTPILRRKDSRWSTATMVSAISNQGKLHFRIQDRPMNKELFIEFLERLIKDESKKIFLIIDNLSVHKSSEVKAWLSKHKNRIELFFLPPYSPELNPDEYVNRALKTEIRLRPSSTEPGKTPWGIAERFMTAMQNNVEHILAVFKNHHVAYAGPSQY